MAYFAFTDNVRNGWEADISAKASLLFLIAVDFSNPVPAIEHHV